MTGKSLGSRKEECEKACNIASCKGDRISLMPPLKNTVSPEIIYEKLQKALRVQTLISLSHQFYYCHLVSRSPLNDFSNVLLKLFPIII